MVYHVCRCVVCGRSWDHRHAPDGTFDAHVCSVTCNEASVFTQDERATRIQVDEVGYDSPVVASLGEIHAANDYDAEVRAALRAVLDGAPLATIGGGASALFTYRIAESKDSREG